MLSIASVPRTLFVQFHANVASMTTEVARCMTATGLASFLALLIARPLVVLFFGGAGLHCLCYAAVTTVCAMACFRRDNLLQMKRNRGHLRETSDETPATALTGEQLQRDLRRRVNLGPRTND